MGFAGGASGKESACQFRRCRRVRFDPWVERIPKRTSWQSTPVFLYCKIPWSEEPCGLHTVHGVAKSRTWLSMHPTHPSHTYLRKSPKLWGQKKMGLATSGIRQTGSVSWGQGWSVEAHVGWGPGPHASETGGHADFACPSPSPPPSSMGREAWKLGQRQAWGKCVWPGAWI